MDADGHKILLLSRSGDSCHAEAVSKRVAPKAAQGQVIPVVSEQLGRADLDYDAVMVHGFGEHEQLPAAWLRHMFSRRLRWIRHVSDTGVMQPYRPWAHRADASRVLFVFPGAPIPLDKGSNQRAFGLLSHLNRAGIGTDLLFTTGSRRALPRVRALLQAVAPRVATYRNNKPLLPPRAMARRGAERLYRAIRGETGKPPDLFAERLHTRAARDGVRQLRSLLQTGRYHTVIVSFAWMTGFLDQVRPTVPRDIRWICDTHDVQFVRGQTQNEHQLRLGVSQRAEQTAELAQLVKYDTVLAISPSDQDELKARLGASRVVLAPSGFDYAYRAVEPSGELPTRFGFIGRDMAPNVAAVDLMLTDWWPRIRKALPDAELHVAGTICTNGSVRDRAQSAGGVRLLGFVPSLASFYDGIDVALNPVVVQGGLNFKSLEAVAAGRPLITTSMGARCLGPSAPVYVADDGAAVADVVRHMASDLSRFHDERAQAQRWCMDQFGEQNALKRLREVLGGD